ncbi:sensor histidine kinase [Nocardioides sp. Kera G14]|uniref:sensor histidine kinase n=1 Tax=Nocardioides sp. Kera G14 TaxID=2884264 RepID=UPI001D0FCDA8|nr:histidine kinase [Nocardioides sp. Kera G14]UDY24913.1 histidine kinase [Nocardioides sp. Kera G14]
MSDVVGQNNRLRVAGPWIATLWLLFLISPFVEGWNRWADHHDGRGIAGMVLVVVFTIVYLRVFMSARDSLRGLGPAIPMTAGVSYVLSLLLLGALITASVGDSGTATAPFVAVSAILLLPLRFGLPLVAVVVGAVLACGAVPGWHDQVGSAFGVIAGSLAVFGFKTVLRRNVELIQAEQDNAQLLVDNERNRFARDLHDILGHSLTVITVKAELAQRLFDVDPERARAEVADLERLSRDALADVRRAVEGYREMTLPGELARARTALEAAEITPRLPQSTDDVPTELRDLFAWTVREGVTNVIRHSHATACEIVLTPTSAEVRDDGRAAASEPGNGLRGLRERASAEGATLETRTLSPGFSLRVAVR